MSELKRMGNVDGRSDGTNACSIFVSWPLEICAAIQAGGKTLRILPFR